MVNNLRVIFVLSLLFSFTLFQAQQDTNYYVIKFADKLGTPHNINSPSSFLSERSIARREKYQIPVLTQDLPIAPNYLQQVFNFPSVSYVTHSKWINSVIILSNDTNDIHQIEALPFVSNSLKYSALMTNEEGKATSKLEVKASKAAIAVNSHYPYGKCYSQNHLHHVDLMHDLGFNGQGIHIAVIDAGFEKADELNGLSHLFNNDQIISTYDFVDQESSVTEDHYHGTAVLSVMAGKIEGEYYGTATQASYHLLRSEDASRESIIEEYFWLAAAEYADSAGSDIINTSLGYSQFDDSTQNHIYADLDGNTTVIAIGSDIASSKGILCVTSAGNLGNSSWGYISTPADADSTLTVGAIDIYEQFADFSSFGPASDGDLKPNVVSVGWLCQLIVPWDTQVIQGNGTSFSAPMMSGMAACLWQALPNKSNIELKTLIESTATLSDSPDTLRGYGTPKIFEAYAQETGITYKAPQELKIEKIYPNPWMNDQDLEILLISPEETEITLLLIDRLGRIVYQRSAKVLQGKNLLTIIDHEMLSAGQYTLVLQNTNYQLQEKLMLNR